MKARPLVVPLLMIAAATAAQAQEYGLTGTHPTRGAFKSRVTLQTTTSGIDVTRRVRYTDGSEQVHTGRVAQTEPFYTAPLYEWVGAAGKLELRKSNVISWSFRPDRVTSATSEPGGVVARARGKQLSPSAAASETKSPKKTIRGRLLGLAGAAAKDALRSGGRVKAEVTEFAHVSVRGKVEAISGSELTPEQRSAQKPGSVWIATELEGGARVGTGSLLTLAGDAVSVGLRAGSTLTYTVVERHPLPLGQSVRQTLANLKGVARAAYSLPLSAREARALGLGAERIMEGRWTIALSGSLGVVDPSGVSARIGGTFGLRRDLRLRVQRLGGAQVRVELRAAKTRSVGVNGRAVLGFALGETIRDAAPESAEFVAKPVGKEVDKALRIRLELSKTRSNTREFELAYRFDLTRTHAAQAYERLIRGDLRSVLGSGVVQERRVVGHELKTVDRAKFDLGILASYDGKRTTIHSAHHKTDANGTRLERRAAVARGKTTSWLGKTEKHRLTLEGLWTTRANRRTDLTIRAHYTGVDEKTSEKEFSRLRGALTSSGFAGAARIPYQEGKSRCALAVTLDKAAFERVLACPSAQVIQTYAAAVHAIENWPRANGRRFAATLAQIRAAPTQVERETLFLELGRQARWNLYELATLARLGAGRGLEVEGNLGGQSFKRGR